MGDEYKEENILNESLHNIASDLPCGDENESLIRGDNVQNFDLINLAYKEGNMDLFQQNIVLFTSNSQCFQMCDSTLFFHHEIPNIISDVLNHADSLYTEDPNRLRSIILRFINSFIIQKNREFLESFLTQDFFTDYITIIQLRDVELFILVSSLIVECFKFDEKYLQQFVESIPIQTIHEVLAYNRLSVGQQNKILDIIFYIFSKNAQLFEIDDVIKFLENIFSIQIEFKKKLHLIEILSEYPDLLPTIGANECIFEFVTDLLENLNPEIKKSSIIILTKLFVHPDCDLFIDLERIAEIIDHSEKELSQSALELVQVMCSNLHCISYLIDNNVIELLRSYCDKSFMHKRITAIAVSNLILNTEASIYEILFNHGIMEVLISSVAVDDDEITKSVLTALLYFIAVKDQPDLFAKVVEEFNRNNGPDMLDSVDDSDDQIYAILGKIKEIIIGEEEE
ncbi:hypothetical protein TVAG_136420 [Trichomonas vaginalis G3]|uniref:Uncharacterized protein n=1 Tax=Trichomonas vaginalis (strain ATCC PRA-98 / G3) TaxID=412133 RepID=A2DJC4_TRIV3|nr:armadillo (ARM) repeat-containing protein family [Trichomonas vaginalis G3]EAY19511.1 hypothetical protein TVAG_136420 [Trichomonas vaginalis G3]KAI5520007.1 armadillo (ARM) repeat-containing protein family [Trichomonas vaginalis G3]|eukprot:XP_001580497.1 hypothetical protein [Trichomonas vaginalis G3]